MNYQHIQITEHAIERFESRFAGYVNYINSLGLTTIEYLQIEFRVANLDRIDNKGTQFFRSGDITFVIVEDRTLATVVSGAYKPKSERQQHKKVFKIRKSAYDKKRSH